MVFSEDKKKDRVMNLYFAPMEAITSFTYRNAHHELFGGIDKYYSPFITPTVDADFRNKEMRDILPENNRVNSLVPQLMTNNADTFLKAAALLKELGYEEVNLNLGCPSKTVTAKKKGSGFLRFTDELDAFLYSIFEKADVKISVKTRAGYAEHGELVHLMEIYNRYPIEELTIHPRIQKDMYNNHPDMDAFRRAYEVSSNPVCYNGDVCTIRDYRKLTDEFPKLSGVMIGRGLLKHPSLARAIKEGLSEELSDTMVLRKFHDRLYAEYSERLVTERNILFKMKELWCHLIEEFSDNSKLRKRLMKAQHLSEYNDIVSEIFSSR